ncbi:MAG: hypothetical protein WDN23_13370 [Edaphobacter sp.]
MKVLTILLIASLSVTTMTAAAQDASKPEPREAVAGRRVDAPAWSADFQLAALNPLPDAPFPAMKTLAPSRLAFAVPQQQPGTPSPPARYPNRNRRKYIVIGVICAAAIVGGIVIATQHD